MKNKEIYNIKDKNSQEILLYLQTKNIKKKNIFTEEYSSQTENKFLIEEKNETLPPTRMKQYINKSIISSNDNNQKIYTTSLSKETKDLTVNNKTPNFNQSPSPSKININTQFSFSEKDNVNNKSVNYLDFHLHENLDKNMKNNEELCHLYLPKKYKDDEKYKSNLYKYLKVENRNNVLRDRGNKTKILAPQPPQDIFLKLSKSNKIKKILSVKKRDLNKINFFDNKVVYSFNLFKDNIIGIDKEWQLPIIYQHYDNDIDSDDEQINKGKEKMLYDLRIAIIKWSQNKKICHNYKYINTTIDNNAYIKKCSISV